MSYWNVNLALNQFKATRSRT